MRAPRLVVSLLLAVLAVPSTAAAQRDGFLAAWVEFYQTLPGVYGDEGRQLQAQLVEAVVEVGAEGALLDHALQRLVRRGDDAHVDLA